METFRQVQACESYYYDIQTGDILRNVGPGSVRCWREGSWRTRERLQEWDESRFEFLTRDISVSFAEVEQLAESRFPGRESGTIVNRQTARQPDHRLFTEEAVSHLPQHVSQGGSEPSQRGETDGH